MNTRRIMSLSAVDDQDIILTSKYTTIESPQSPNALLVTKEISQILNGSWTEEGLDQLNSILQDPCVIEKCKAPEIPN
ncbi:hypothetical protein KM1_096480 [Entamoeba histolytica HM-3:IMSS]|uniref:Uncharacterized protein n=1 Tax=Entamoeba histolytica HM-3:IMSS TaxID=885315 RepID=M7W6D0_ENTHI|nr:hypothetical protein KM1_096480 [Entamoeba histolytica HM-3:IMSS]